MAARWMVLFVLLSGCQSRDFCDDCVGHGVTYSYVLTTADLPAADPLGHLVGFDLDALPGTGAGMRCDDALDFVSPISGATDVDNQLAASVLPDRPDVRALFEAEAAAGRTLLVLEVADIDSFTRDESIAVRVISARLGPGTEAPLLEGGRLSSEQTFVMGSVVTLVTEARIVNHRLEMRADALPLSLSIGAPASPVSFTMRDAVLSATIDAFGLHDGELGARISVADLVALASAFDTAATEETIRAALSPDLSPNADGTECDGVSAGLTFEATFTPNLEPPP
jgi:hypothetical protein